MDAGMNLARDYSAKANNWPSQYSVETILR